MTVYSTDSFDRTNSTTSLGTTDGSGSLDPLTWVQDAGTWGISANKAYTSTGANPALAHVDATHADITLAITVSVVESGTSAGLIFRYTDTSNYWRCSQTGAGNLALFKVVAGTPTQIGSNVAGGANGDKISVVLNGTSIAAYRNGVSQITTTDAHNSTATKHGLWIANTSVNNRLDDWLAADLTVKIAVLSATATQTPTLRKSTPKSMSVTQTQTPTVSKPKSKTQTLTVTNQQTPATLDALGGHRTTASGNEAAPVYAIKVVDMRGASPVTLANAEPDSITWTLNQPDEFAFHFPKNAYANTDVPAIGTGAGVKEVQIFRNSDLRAWGPVLQRQASGGDGAVQCTGAGVDWYLNRRFVDGLIPNLVTNPDFESGATGWTANNVTFTQPTNNFVTGSKSAKLVSTSAWADTQIHQNGIVAGPNGVGVLVTASAWFFIETFTAAAFGNLGLYIEGGPTGSANTINNYFPIDNATRRGEWQKTLGVTLWVPPGETWDINVRLYGPQGTIYWDDVKLVAMDSVGTANITGSVNTPTDIANIMQMLVGHVQRTSAGKSWLNIGTHTETTGVTMTKHYQFVDHVQFDQAVKEFMDRDDGADYSMDYTPTTRTWHSYANKRGTDRSGAVTLKYDVASPSTSNCTTYGFSDDAGGCITRQTVLGEDNGPEREQGEASDATNVGGVILQDVRQAPQNSKTASLQPLADERISRFSAVPVTIDMDLQGDSGLIPTLGCGDLVTVVIADGFVAVNGVYRIMRMHLDCKENVLTVTLATDTL